MTKAEQSTINDTIAAILNQIAADCAKCATTAAEANAAMTEDNRNLAIGTLLGIETEIDRLAALKATVLALHRSR